MYIFGDQRVTWQAANVWCNEKAMELISLHSDAEFDALKQALNDSAHFQFSHWIGLYHDGHPTNASTYRWSDESVFDFGFDVSGGVFPWKRVNGINPNSLISPSCVRLQSNADPKWSWDDIDCNGTTNDLLALPICLGPTTTSHPSMMPTTESDPSPVPSPSPTINLGIDTDRNPLSGLRSEDTTTTLMPSIKINQYIQSEENESSESESEDIYIERTELILYGVIIGISFLFVLFCGCYCCDCYNRRRHKKEKNESKKSYSTPKPADFHPPSSIDDENVHILHSMKASNNQHEIQSIYDIRAELETLKTRMAEMEQRMNCEEIHEEKMDQIHEQMMSDQDLKEEELEFKVNQLNQAKNAMNDNCVPLAEAEYTRNVLNAYLIMKYHVISESTDRCKCRWHILALGIVSYMTMAIQTCSMILLMLIYIWSGDYKDYTVTQNLLYNIFPERNLNVTMFYMLPFYIIGITAVRSESVQSVYGY